MEDHKQDIEKIFEFLHIVGNLKSTIRFSKSINMPKDTSASHSWRLALMTMIVSDGLNLDIDKLQAFKLAIIHDIAESITGDIDYRRIAAGEITKEEKQRLEYLAMNQLKEILPKHMGEEIYQLFEEYENMDNKLLKR